MPKHEISNRFGEDDVAKDEECERNELEESVQDEEDERPKQRFKVVGLLVKAMQRLQASLNPKVDFRKRNRPGDTPATGAEQLRTMSGPDGDNKFVSRGMPIQKSVGLGRNSSGPTFQRSSLGSGRSGGGSGGGSGLSTGGLAKSPSHHGHMLNYLLKPLPQVGSGATI